jgi:hypothetical protein
LTSLHGVISLLLYDICALLLSGSTNAQMVSLFNIRILVPIELAVQTRLQEGGFGSLVGELKGV